MLHEFLKELYKFEDDRVKSHRVPAIPWITYKHEALNNMLDKYRLYTPYFENII